MFVTFEGPEGAGKSTALEAAAALLRREGHKTLLTREPGAGELGALIRMVILAGGDLDPNSELFLFLADRANHISAIIRPALENGFIVLCDRFSDSTLAYQGYGRGMDMDFLRKCNEFATGGIRPTMTLLFDLDPEHGLQRLESKDRLDREPLDFHQRVRGGFLAEAKRDPARWVILDASLPAVEVLAETMLAIRTRL